MIASEKKIARYLEDMNFILSWHARTISHLLAALTRVILLLPREHKIHLFSLRLLAALTHLLAAFTRVILLLPQEHKIHLFSPPCNILYDRGNPNNQSYWSRFNRCLKERYEATSYLGVIKRAVYKLNNTQDIIRLEIQLLV